MVNHIGVSIVGRKVLMTKREQATMEHYEFCYDQVSKEYTKACDENQKLESYVEQLQTLCRLNGVEYPPIEEPIKF